MSILRDDFITIPNLLTVYRLAMAPVIIAFALTEARTLFIVFLCISFATDVLDGLTARVFNLCTPLGAKLDSLADELTYLAALAGIFQFEYQALKPHIAMLYIFLGFLVLAALIPLIKFRKTPSFHLYSFKANALLQGIFIVTLFVFGFNAPLYYFVMGFGVLACVESITVSLVIDKPITNARSLFWILDNRNRAP